MEPRFVGRAVEFNLFAGHLDALHRGESSILVVEGPAGLGKTRFLTEARQLALRRGVRSVTGLGDPDAGPIPFGLLLGALADERDPVVDPAVLRDLTARTDLRFWVFREMTHALARAAAEKPVMVLLDDLQWADEESLFAMRTLPERLRGSALLWVVAVREGERGPAVRSTLARLGAGPGARTVRLPPLTADAMSELAADLLGADTLDETVAEAAGRADGSPLLFVTLLRGLCEEGALQVTGGRARITRRTVPVACLEAVRAQLSRLSGPAREYVQLASVLERGFTAEQLAGLAGARAGTLIAGLQEAVAAGVLTEREGRLAFRRDLVRAAVAAAMPAVLRRTLRREAEQPAPADPLDDNGGEFLTGPAGSAPGSGLAMVRYAMAEVAPRSPLAAGLDTPARGAGAGNDVASAVGPLLLRDAQVDRAVDLAESALALLPDAESEGRLRLGLAMLSAQRSFAESVRQARAGLALTGLPDSLRAELLAVLSVGQQLLCDLDGCRRTAGQALKVARRAGNARAETMALSSHATVAFYQGEWQRALEWADEAERASATADVEFPLSVLCGARKCHVLTAAGRCGRALEIADRGIAAAARHGDSAASRLWLGMRSRVLADLGRLPDALAEADAAGESADEVGSGSSLRTRIALQTGGEDELRRCAERACRVRRTAGLGAFLGAMAADALGEPGRTRELLRRCEARLSSDWAGFASPADPADEVTFVRLALRVGERGLALHAVVALERLAARNPGFPLLAGLSRHARGLIADDPEPLLEAVERLDACERPLVAASADEDAGRRLLGTEPARGAELLGRALAAYEATGAHRAARRVRERLGQSVSDRPRRRTGLAVLTPSERAVVDLVAAGATNREAAQRLFLSPHTVNTHLRRTFAKLGIRSRVQLVRLVATEEPGHAGGRRGTEGFR